MALKLTINIFNLIIKIYKEIFFLGLKTAIIHAFSKVTVLLHLMNYVMVGFLNDIVL